MSAFEGKADKTQSGHQRTYDHFVCRKSLLKSGQKRQSRWRGYMPTALPSSTGRAAPRTASAELSNRKIIPDSRSDQKSIPLCAAAPKGTVMNQTNQNL